MPSGIVRIGNTAKEVLHQLADLEHLSMQAMLDRVIEYYRRQRLFEQANAGYAELRQDPKAWQAYQKEMVEWDVTLMDGLKNEESFVSDQKSKYRAHRTKKRERNS